MHTENEAIIVASIVIIITIIILYYIILYDNYDVQQALRRTNTDRSQHVETMRYRNLRRSSKMLPPFSAVSESFPKAWRSVHEEACFLLLMICSPASIGPYLAQ